MLSSLNTKPSDAILVLNHLSSLPVSSLVSYSSSLLPSLPLLLEEGVSKRIQQLFTSLWMKLNSVIPRRCGLINYFCNLIAVGCGWRLLMHFVQMTRSYTHFIHIRIFWKFHSLYFSVINVFSGIFDICVAKKLPNAIYEEVYMYIMHLTLGLDAR